jgi:hypothetical protein
MLLKGEKYGKEGTLFQQAAPKRGMVFQNILSQK